MTVPAVRHGSGTGVVPGEGFPRFQKNYWYESSTPTGSTLDPGPEYVDYHLAPDPAPAPHYSTDLPPVVYSDKPTNVTVQVNS